MSKGGLEVEIAGQLGSCSAATRLYLATAPAPPVCCQQDLVFLQGTTTL